MVIAPNITAIIGNQVQSDLQSFPTPTVQLGQQTGPDQYLSEVKVTTRTYQGGAAFANGGTLPFTFTPPFEAEILVITGGGQWPQPFYKYEFVPVIGQLTIPPGAIALLRKKLTNV